MALTVTAIAACTTVAPEPSVEIRMICAGPAQTNSVLASAQPQAEMGVMRERADAEIGRKQHQGEDRRGDRPHSPCEGAQRTLPLGESSGGSATGDRTKVGVVPRITLAKPADVKRTPSQGCHAAAAAQPADAPVPQHETGPSGAPDTVAEIVRRRPRVGADPHLVERAGAPRAHQRAQQARVLIADDGAQPLHGARIHRQRLVAVKAGGELNAPRFRRRKLDVLLQLGDEGIGRAPEQRHQLPATGVRRAIGHLAVLAGGGPVVDRGAGDGGDVIARLLRHRAGSGEPFLHPPRAGIVGGSGQPEIAELAAQLAEEFSRFRQRLHGIEGIEQPALAGGSRHELRDAFARAGRCG